MGWDNAAINSAPATTQPLGRCSPRSHHAPRPRGGSSCAVEKPAGRPLEPQRLRNSSFSRTKSISTATSPPGARLAELSAQKTAIKEEFSHAAQEQSGLPSSHPYPPDPRRCPCHLNHAGLRWAHLDASGCHGLALNSFTDTAAVLGGSQERSQQRGLEGFLRPAASIEEHDVPKSPPWSVLGALGGPPGLS